jgi:hypothetical protein
LLEHDGLIVWAATLVRGRSTPASLISRLPASLSERDGLVSNCSRLLDREENLGIEAQPGRPRCQRLCQVCSTTRLDDRHTAGTIGIAVEALELSLTWLPPCKDAERALLALLGVVYNSHVIWKSTSITPLMLASRGSENVIPSGSDVNRVLDLLTVARSECSEIGQRRQETVLTIR